MLRENGDPADGRCDLRPFPGVAPQVGDSQSGQVYLLTGRCVEGDADGVSGERDRAVPGGVGGVVEEGGEVVESSSEVVNTLLT